MEFRSCGRQVSDVYVYFLVLGKGTFLLAINVRSESLSSM